ncbi:hypothetical protein R1sor_012398 [Riccia sorocarpa]|uniref:NB-ARC domain-containing protein n=1 Tax=Riccia sorocarpa TaxID=122646 RepID=A0ABD3I7N7_9MARC
MQNKRPRLDGASSRRLNHEVESTQEEIRKVSDALYVLYEPKRAESANLDIFFFHGLECEGAHVRDAHILTWGSTGRKQEIWPQKWLSEDFPQARIISVSYDCCTKQTETEGRMDLYLIGESLVQEIRWARERCPNRPVILVGHGFGGVVLKKLCVNAQEKKGNSEFGKDMDMLLESIRGFFFYSTPHLGIEGMPPQAENEGLLLRWMRMLDSNSARLHGTFSSMLSERRFRWRISGVGEVESTLERHGLRVPEASARFGDNYITVQGDHFSVCRPFDKSDNRYIHLRNLIEDVQRQAELETKQPLLVPEVLVGVDGVLTEILGNHIRDHKFLGFWGMGGVGKTTLAKVMFNKIHARFEFSCFVQEIKQLSGTNDEVKKKIWEKMCRHGVPVCGTSGSGAGSWYQVTGKSLLVVFDDVEDIEHVKLLKEIAHDNRMEESRFILTSRDINRLRDCGQEHEIHVCQLDGLKFEDAKRLFVTYAFPGKQEPPESFRRVVKEVVDGCGGLPLTLEVLGNYLRGKEMEHWEEIPTALGECDQVADLEEKVWAKLQLSYDRLPGNEEKYMFLEIASLGEFFGETVFSDFHGDSYHPFSVDDAVWAWTSIYGSGRNRLRTLEDRALVRILDCKDWKGRDDRRFYMHEHLKKMGLRIARLEGRSSNLSRVDLKYPVDDEIIFQEDEDLGKIGAQTISIKDHKQWPEPPGQSCPSCIVSEVWSKLTAIRYMDLRVCTFRFCHKCRNRGCPLPNTLVLFQSDLYEEGDFVISGSGKNFLGERRETMVSTSTSLVHLQLNGCITVDCGGLNELRRLRILKISSCGAILNWPTSLSKLKDLKQLELAVLGKPFELPRTFGKLTNLEHLSIKNCKLSSVPSSVRNWQTALGELTNLKRLELESVDTPFELPDTFGDLTNLEHLSINQCKVGSIPSSLQNLTRLRVLKVSEVVGRQAIPDIIRFLRQVQSLHLKCWGIVNLVDALREMTALTELHLECEGIKELPDTFGILTNLEKLQLRCPIEWLPASFADLTRLETLKIEGRFGLVDRCVDELSYTKWIEKLELYRNFMLVDSHWIDKDCVVCLREDEIVHPIFSSFHHLEGFMIKQKDFGLDCQHGMSALIVRNMIGLESLEIKVRGSQAVPDIFGDLQKLRIFKLTCEAMESSLVESLERLSSLEELHLACKTVEQLPDVFGSFVTLKTLWIECPSLQALPNTFGNFVELTTLRIRATGLRSLPDAFANLTRLETLKLEGRFGIVWVGKLNQMKWVEEQELRRFGMVDSQWIDKDCVVCLRENEIIHPIYPSFGHQGFMTKQKSLHLDCQHGMSAVIVRNMIGLESLEIRVRGPQAVPDIFGDLQKLRIFKLTCEAVESSLVESLERLSSLEELHLACKTVEQLPDVFGSFSTLKTLRIECPSLQALPNTSGNIVELTTLPIRATGLRTLPDAFANLTRLETLKLEGRFGIVWVGKLNDMAWVEKQELNRRFGMVDSQWINKDCVVCFRENEIIHPIYPSFGHLQGFMTKQKSLHLDCQHGMSAVIVRNMIGLESLEIKVRGSQAVPDIFGDLEKLLIFKLTCEAMESNLVESLERLSSLEELDLVCKTVERLPDVFGCFSTLKTLRIECPSLQALPDTFGNFVELTTLSISATLLRTLPPDALAQVPQLEEFHLTGCDTLTTFSDLVGCSSSLGPWEISRITPQTMWQLPRLKELEVSGHTSACGSDSESHPADQWQLPRLKELEELRTLPEALGNLQSLRRLECERCGFESLPESLGRLSGLTSLTIRDCGNLKTLPETIGDLSSLKNLYIYRCENLKTLPETIEDLSSLKILVYRPL